MNPTSNNKITGFDLFSPEQVNRDKNNLSANAAYHTSIEFIQRAGICCQLPMKTINTAIMIFLRYFANNDITEEEPEHSINDICRCALFSATKIEETPCRIRDIMNATHKITCPNDKVLNPNSKNWHLWKDKLIELESIILNEINFEFNAVHPHQFVLHQCNELKTSIPIAKLSWSICNDCMYNRHIMLSYKPHQISAAAIYIAAEFLSNVQTNNNDEEMGGTSPVNHNNHNNNQHPVTPSSMIYDGTYDATKEANWWRRFDIDDFVLNTICTLIMDIYESPFAKFECEDQQNSAKKKKKRKKKGNNNNDEKEDGNEEEEEHKEDEDDDLIIKTPSPQKRSNDIMKDDNNNNNSNGKEEMSDDDEDNDIEM